MEEIETRILTHLQAAKSGSSPTLQDACHTLEAYEQWQLQLATWLESFTRKCVPSTIPLPNLDAFRVNSTLSTSGGFPIAELLRTVESNGVEASPGLSSSEEQTTRQPLRSLTRGLSTEASIVTPISPSSSATQSSTDANHRLKITYANRPFSGKRLQPTEPSYSLVQHGTATNASRFPTLVQMNVNEVVDAKSTVAALPASNVATSIAPSTTASSSFPVAFVPLASLSTPSPPTVAKSSHRYQPPPAPVVTNSSPSVRVASTTMIQALMQTIDEQQEQIRSLETQVTTLQSRPPPAPIIQQPASTLSTNVDNLPLASSASVPTIVSDPISPLAALPSSPPPIANEATPTSSSRQNVAASSTTTITPAIVVSPAPPSRPTLASTTRPAFIVSTSLPHTPLSLGVTATSTLASKSASDALQRRQAKELERAAALAAAQQSAALEAEKERKRREALKATLAQQKKEKEERERAKAEADAAAARLAKQKEKEAQAKRKEELERLKKAKEEEAAAAAVALAEAEAAAKKKKKKRASTTNDSPAELPLVTAIQSVPPLDAPSSELAPFAAPSYTPTLSSAPSEPISPSASVAPPSTKSKKSVKPVLIDYGCQTDDLVTDDATTEAWISKRFQLTPEQLEEDASEAKELALMTLKDQVAKLKLDLRYSKLRVRGLDEETKSQLKRIQQQKDELSKQAWIMKEQAEELKEWRLEANKLVSTGLTSVDSKTKQEESTPIESDPSAVKSNPLVPNPPPHLDESISKNPAYLAWLRSLFDQLQSLDRRRKEAEKVTAETIERGRMAELNLLEVWQRNEKLQGQLAAFSKLS